MIFLFPQALLALLSCLAWTVSGQSEMEGVYLYMDTLVADYYYRIDNEGHHFYIQNGRVNAVDDEIPIIVSNQSLTFHWYDSVSPTVLTAFTAVSNDVSILMTPSVPLVTQVPPEPTTITFNFTCLAQGTVNANITFRFIVNSAASIPTVTISFRKACAEGGNTASPTEGGVSSDVKEILYAVTGLVAGIVLLIIVIVVVYHWKVLAGILKRRRSSSQSDDDIDMSRDALHEAVFGMLQQYQEEPSSYAYASQEPTHPTQEPGPPAYTSCDEAPNGPAFPYQLAVVNNMGLVTPGNQATPSQSTANFHSRHGHRPMSASWSSLPLNLKGKHIDVSRITVGELIRQGSFTQVRNGYLANAEDDVEGATPVMIKTVKGDAPGSIISQLVEGVAMLLHCDHRHCMPLFGVHYGDNTPPMFLFPRTKYGTLKHTLLDLQENGFRSRFNRMLSPQDLVFLAMQIARGMYHLTKKAELVHKDLAARNVFVHDNLQIKVGDSALSWDLFPDDYQMLATGEMIATKWQPVEVLSEGNYTMYSDVWSFGVVLWEVFTLGQSPYKEVPAEHMYNYLTSGQRLSQPTSCPDEVFTLMGQCWALTALDRPRFSYLTVALEEFHNKLNCFI